MYMKLKINLVLVKSSYLSVSERMAGCQVQNCQVQNVVTSNCWILVEMLRLSRPGRDTIACWQEQCPIENSEPTETRGAGVPGTKKLRLNFIHFPGMSF